MDTVSNKEAQTEIAAIKVAARSIAPKIVDRAIQVHGGARVTDDFALAMAWAHLRTLRLADGPDEVHKRAIARHDLGKHRDQDAWTSQSITRRSSVSIPRRRRDARWISEGN